MPRGEGAGVGDGEPGGDGGPVFAGPLAKPRSSFDRAGLGLAGPGFQSFAAAVAEHVCELADQITGGVEFGAAGGDLRERGTVVAGHLTRRGEHPAGYLFCLGRWRSGRDGGVLASRAVSRRKVRRLPR
jgi:hypothetical protein